MWTLTGSVQGERGETPSGITVRAIPRDADKQKAECEQGGVRCGKFDSDGNFTIPYLTPGTYLVVACSAGSDKLGFRPLYKPDVEPLEVRNDRPLPRMDIVLTRATSVHVTQITPEVPYCFDDKGQLKGGDCRVVRVYDDATGCLIQYAVTDKQGHVQFAGEDDRRYSFLPSNQSPNSCAAGSTPQKPDDLKRLSCGK